MQVIRGIRNLRDCHQPCVLTIGNFDGVHLGHQAIIKKLISAARRFNVPSTIILFEPHPIEFFRADEKPARIMSLGEKIRMLESLKVDRLLVLRFNLELSQMLAEDFIEDLLVRKLGIKMMIVGDDFRFGHKRKGDFSMLSAAGSRFNFSVEATDSLLVAQARASSTQIRALLGQGLMQQAGAILGRPYRISGRVIYGDQRGREIGFPTVNIGLKRYNRPISGVFVVLVSLANGRKVKGVANIGKRPTVGGNQYLLEAHLFDFREDIYGVRIQVEFLAKLREEVKFDSMKQMADRIEIDVLKAQQWFIGKGDIAKQGLR